MNIYVGNIAHAMQENELAELFTQFGQVQSAKIIMDRESGRSRGFGFVEMPESSEAQKAIDDLNGKEVMGRKLVVNEAHNRKEGGGGGNRFGGGNRSQGGGGGGRRFSR